VVSGAGVTARTAAGIETWSTSLVEPARRLDYWIGAVCECFLEMDIETPVRTDFDCSIQRGQLDVIGINRVQGSAQHVYRRKASVARATSNYYYLLCKPDNEWTVMQNGHSARMRPLDLVLLDSRRCYDFNFPINADTLSLELPIAWVESWINDPDRRIGQRIDGRSGWGAALSAFACQLTPQLAIDRPLPVPVLTDQLGALLALAYGSEIPATPAEQRDAARLLDQIGRAIRLHYAEPGLTAATVAERLRISQRTLHRCLNNAGLTFTGLLGDCRMTAARRMLSEPRFDHIGIAGIGLRVGLSDPSHFIRQCRRYLGMTPAAFRRQR
jgi:AraC family transcriptional activator of tynA and feaB